MKKNINEFNDRATTVLVVPCITFSRLSLPKQGVCKRCCTVTRTDTVRQESQWTQPPEAGIIWDNAIIVSHWLALRLYGRTANRLSLPKQGFLAVSLTLCTIDVYWKYVYRKELQHLGGSKKTYRSTMPKREGCKGKKLDIRNWFAQSRVRSLGIFWRCKWCSTQRTRPALDKPISWIVRVT